MKTRSLTIFFVLAEIVGSSCAARYGTKRRSNPDGAQANQNQNPATKPGEESSGKDGLGPIVGIEVVLDGKVVSQIPKGKEVILRPSSETRDGDNPPRADCMHPGILEAKYTIQGATQLTKKSKDGCEKMEVSHVFSETGSIPVELKVLTDESESASASTTVAVVEDSPDAELQASLSISANPMEANIGESISFSASCSGKNPPESIAWQFGDEAKALGKDTTHSYTIAGSFKVSANCKIDGKELTATLTVLIKSPAGGSSGGEGSSSSSTGGDGNDKSSSGTGGDDGSKTGSGSSGGTTGSGTGGQTGSSGSSTGSGSGTSGGGTSVPEEDDGGKTNPGQVGQNPAQRPNQN